MSKNLWLSVAAVVVVLISITLIVLLILLPQESPTQGTAGKEYNQISKQEYIYTPTKGITEGALVEEYRVGTESVREGKADKNYTPGNSDPFASQSSSGTGTSTTTGGTTTGETTTGGTTTPPADAANK